MIQHLGIFLHGQGALQGGAVLLHPDARQNPAGQAPLCGLLAAQHGQIVRFPVRVTNETGYQNRLHLLGGVPGTGNQGLVGSLGAVGTIGEGVQPFDCHDPGGGGAVKRRVRQGIQSRWGDKVLLHGLINELFGALLVPGLLQNRQYGNAVPYRQTAGEQGVYKGVHVPLLSLIHGKSVGGAVARTGKAEEDDAPAGECIPTGQLLIGLQSFTDIGEIAIFVADGLEDGGAVSQGTLAGQVVVDNGLFRALTEYLVHKGQDHAVQLLHPFAVLAVLQLRQQAAQAIVALQV